MAMFDVYVEGATDPSPQALQRLAEVMSQRYGLPAADVAARLSKGRFRVKANVDEETAATYVRDLEAVGARVALAEARSASTLPPPRQASRSQSPSQPPPHPVTVPPRQRNESRSGAYSLNRASAPSLPPATQPARPSPLPLPPPNQEPRPAASSLPPANAPRPQPGPALPPRAGGSSMSPSNQPYASGLSAAFHEDTPVPDIRAFDANMSVGTLDGVADDMQVDFDPQLPASIGPATKPVAPAKPPKLKDDPVDLFAPPESEASDLKVELAADEVAHRDARKKAATPAPGVPIAVGPSASSPVLRPNKPSIQPQNERSSGVRLPSTGDDEHPRWRFAAGVITAVVLGFIPATLVQSCRENAAFENIDHHVATVQQQAVSNASATIPVAQLDAFRDDQLAKKKSERRNIALVSMLIWALGGAGIGYVWFRRVPWDKIKFGS